MGELVQVLIEKLSSSDIFVREVAINRLVAMQEEVVPALINVMLYGQDDAVSEQVIKVIRMIGNPAYPALFKSLYSTPLRGRTLSTFKQIENLLTFVYDSAIKAIIQIIIDQYSQRSYSFYELDDLVRIGHFTFTRLKDSLEIEDHHIVTTASASLARIEEAVSEAIPQLNTLLSNSNSYDLRRTIGKAFGAFGEQGLYELKKMLTSSSIDVRRAAIYGLPENDTKEVMGMLTQALNDTAWQVRWAAAQRLYSVGRRILREDILQQLRQLKDDPHWRIRREATHAVKWIEEGIEWRQKSQERDTKSD